MTCRKDLNNGFRDRIEISETDGRNIRFRSCCRDHRVIQYRAGRGEGCIPAAEQLHEVAERSSLDNSRFSRPCSFCRVGIHLRAYKGGGKDRSEPLDWVPYWSRGHSGARPCSLVCLCVKDVSQRQIL